jgi:hypothetical protein
MVLHALTLDFLQSNTYTPLMCQFKKKYRLASRSVCTLSETQFFPMNEVNRFCCCAKGSFGDVFKSSGNSV